jgi:hypothetical protein
MPELRRLLSLLPPDTAVAARIHVVVFVAAHCLFVREVMKYYPRFDSVALFNGMGAEMKRLLSASSVRFTSPREIFPDDEERRALVGSFFRPDEIDEEERFVAPDRLFDILSSFYMPHFLSSFDRLKIGKISMLSSPKTSEAMALFIVHATFYSTDEIPIALHDTCVDLTARMLGLIKVILDESPIC